MEAKSIALLSILLRGSKLLDQKVEEVAKRWQLSLSEAKILSFLCQAPHMNTACSIAKYCGMSKASVSGNVLKLVGRGLLKMDVDLADRRFQHLTPTEQAVPIREDIYYRAEDFVHQLLSPLTAEEQSEFLRLLSRINQHADD